MFGFVDVPSRSFSCFPLEGIYRVGRVSLTLLMAPMAIEYLELTFGSTASSGLTQLGHIQKECSQQRSPRTFCSPGVKHHLLGHANSSFSRMSLGCFPSLKFRKGKPQPRQKKLDDGRPVASPRHDLVAFPAHPTSRAQVKPSRSSSAASPLSSGRTACARWASHCRSRSERAACAVSGRFSGSLWASSPMLHA